MHGGAKNRQSSSELRPSGYRAQIERGKSDPRLGRERSDGAAASTKMEIELKQVKDPVEAENKEEERQR